MFSEDITLLTEEQVLGGIKELKRRKGSFNTDSTWPDIAYAIGCCKEGKVDKNWAHNTAAYKPFQQDMKHLTHGTKKDRLDKGNNAIGNIKDLLRG